MTSKAYHGPTPASVYEALRRTAERYGERPFLHIPAEACREYADSAVELSYGQARDAVDAASERYRAAGLGVGLRVALALENRAEFFVHWIALNRLGVSVVPINHEMGVEEQAYLLSHSGTRLAVSLDRHAEAIERACALAGTGGQVVTPDRPVPPVSGSVVDGPPRPDTECAVMYTSGSTGKPKGCLLSNDYYLRYGRWYGEIGGACRLSEGEERLLTPLPLVHMNAMAVSTMAMIASGGCIVQLDRFHPSGWWQVVHDSGATIVHYLGVMPAMLLGMPEEAGEHRVRFGFGAGVNPRHHAAFESRFGFPLIEAWAMTETGSGGTVIANVEPRHVGTSCFGRPAPAVAHRIVDDTGQEVSPGAPGELLVRASGEDPRRGFFSGYLHDEAATEAGWADGWWHTGDIVRTLPDGSLCFVDRQKNIIRRSGENIGALEVEAVLSVVLAGGDALVSAVPDELRGEEVMAIVRMPEMPADPDAVARALVAGALEHLAYYKVPGYVGFVDQLPLTASQKPRRADLKALGRELLRTGRCFDLRALKKRPARTPS